MENVVAIPNIKDQPMDWFLFWISALTDQGQQFVARRGKGRIAG